MYMRYKIVEKQSEACYFGAPVFNLVALVLGFVGCFGMGIVANFQVWPECLGWLTVEESMRGRNSRHQLVLGELGAGH